MQEIKKMQEKMQGKMQEKSMWVYLCQEETLAEITDPRSSSGFVWSSVCHKSRRQNIKEEIFVYDEKGRIVFRLVACDRVCADHYPSGRKEPCWTCRQKSKQSCKAHQRHWVLNIESGSEECGHIVLKIIRKRHIISGGYKDFYDNLCKQIRASYKRTPVSCKSVPVQPIDRSMLEAHVEQLGQADVHMLFQSFLQGV